jgi:hypothetical protein
MDQLHIESIIQFLENVRNRPLMYVTNINELAPFLDGFNNACLTLGMNCGTDKALLDTVTERGWEWSVAGRTLPSMRKRGLDETAIALEILNIEIEAWKKRYAGTR